MFWLTVIGFWCLPFITAGNGKFMPGAYKKAPSKMKLVVLWKQTKCSPQCDALCV